MAKLNFNTTMLRRQPIRANLSRYNQSDIPQGVFELSDGERPWVALYPYRYLPVMRQDTSIEDYIVINKGKIVSLLTNMNSTMATSGAITNISSTGSGYVYNDATATSTSLQLVADDGEYFGYDDSVFGLLVPANQGNVTNLTYSTLDNSSNASTYKSDGTIASSGDVLTLPANYPVGVIMGDVYQDIRGKYLNYQMWGTDGILCDYYVEIPYYDHNGTSTQTFGTSPSTSVYDAVWRNHAFMYCNSSSSATTPFAGMLVQPDQWGEYALTSTDSIQVMGRVIGTDSRYPKHFMELVDTYPGSQTAGTDTGGLPAHLWKFVYDARNAASASVTINNVVAAVQNGTFGIVRIQLNI